MNLNRMGNICTLSSVISFATMTVHKISAKFTNLSCREERERKKRGMKREGERG